MNTIQYNTIQNNTIQYNTIQYNTIQYKYEYYYSGINPIEFRGPSKRRSFWKITNNCNWSISKQSGLEAFCGNGRYKKIFGGCIALYSQGGFHQHKPCHGLAQNATRVVVSSDC